jgi:hypothetical protein
VSVSPLDPGGPGLVLNIGGQGEIAYAIDVAAASGSLP